MALNESEIEHYHREGFVTVSGLIPPVLVERAASALAALNAADSEAQQNRVGSIHKAYENPDLRAVYTEDVYEAIATLVNDSRENIAPPEIPYSIIIPKNDNPEIKEQPHLDWMNPNSVTDPEFRITVMVYLSTAELNGGSTLVWPRSNRRARELIKDRQAYPTFADLQREITCGVLKFGDPVETTPKKGDVVFIDSWMIHAGGINRNDQPRLALNWKW